MLVALLAGCGGPSLKHAGKKALVYTRAGTQGSALGTLALHTSLCAELDPATVTATFGGRALQLVSPPTSADHACAPTVWRETTPTPSSEAQTVFEVSDGTEVVHVTYGGLTQPPVVEKSASNLRPGGQLQVALQSSHASDAIQEADFVPNGPHGEAGKWEVHAPTSSDAPWTVTVPDDGEGSMGALTFAVSSVIAMACDADVACGEQSFIDRSGATFVVHTEVSFATAPVPVKISRH